MRISVGFIGLAWALSACGSAPAPASDAVSTSDLDTYRSLAEQTQAAASSYRATMTGAGATLATCATIHDAYDGQVRPWISKMSGMSGSLDGYIDAHHGGDFADLTCVVAGMLAELDAHRAAACASPDFGIDRAEAVRHADAMATYAGHQLQRCGEMGRGMGGGGWNWGPMMNGCQWAVPPGGSADAGVPSADAGVAPGGTTDPLAIGQRIFQQGIGIDGQRIARTGGMGMGTYGCAMCHGYDGHGWRMMMFTAPNITYANLTDPAGMHEPDGTRGPTYTDPLIRRAVIDGIDPAGEALASWMPRWQLTDAEWTGLLAYLATLH